MNHNYICSPKSFLFTFILFVCSIIVAPFWMFGQQNVSESPSNSYLNKLDHTQTLWYLEMQKEQPNVLLAEKYFVEYFHQYPNEMSKQRKLFMRWLTSSRLYVDEVGFQTKPKIESYKALGTAANQQEATNKSYNGSWRMIGPNHHKRDRCNGESSNMSGGYVDRVYINPYNTQNLLAGFSYGGLWVSQDQGDTWVLTDAEFPNGTNDYANNDRYYGDIKASAANSNTIYAATEAGLLKSIDSGNSWMYCATLNRTEDFNNRPYFMTVSPDNADVVVSTFGKKVYRSIDGGDSWVLAFDNTNGGNEHYFTNQHVTSPYGLHSRAYNFFGLEIDYANPNVLFLGVWNNSNEPCIYKSTDGGISFNFLINLNTVNGQTMPNNLKLQTIGATTGKFYVYPEWETNNTFYTYDANGNLLQSNPFNTQSEAGDLSFTDENVFYNGHYFSSSIHKSLNRGTSFEDMMDGSYGGCPDGNKYVHADVRAIDVVGNLVLIGTDGGMTLSKDGMLSAKTIGHEISAADLWGFSSSLRSDICVAGMDHGPSTIRKYDGDAGWEDRGGGDAIHASVNQSHDRWVYYDTQYGVYKEYVNSDNTLSDRIALNLPFKVDRLEFHPNIFTIGYGISSNILYRTQDHFDDTEIVYTFSNNIRRFRTSKENADIFYVLLSNNEIQKSIDGGQSWSNITPSIGSNFIDIALGTIDEIFVLLGNESNTEKILQSTDGGSSWINQTSPNLPTAAPSEITYQIGTNGGIYMAFAGMHGVWYKNNTMSQWEKLGDTPPMFAYVKNIFAVPNQGKYRMGSSRGAWEHDLYENSAPIANFSVRTNKITCSNQLITFVDNSTASSNNLSYAWSFSSGNPSTSTQASPTVSYAAPGFYDVSLTVTENGQSHTKTIPNFIEVTDECGSENLMPYTPSIGCENIIPESNSLNDGESVLIKDFSSESGEEFYIDLNIYNNCSNTNVKLKAVIDVNHNKINVIEYNHFNSTYPSPIYGSETDSLTSFETDFGQIAFSLNNGQLFLKSISNACASTIKLSSSCWSNLCAGNIPQTNLMNGGDEVLIKDFATEMGSVFYVNLKSYVNCYGTTASLSALVDIDKQEIQVESYYHFNETTNGGLEGDGTNIVTSTSAAYGKIAYRLNGTQLYFQLVSQACGSTGRLLNSCFYSLDCSSLLNQSCDDNDDCTINDIYDVNCNCVGTFQDTDNDGVCDADESISLQMKVFLQGALLNSTDNLMRDDLRQNNLIPLNEPYSNITYFSHYGDGGNESIAPTLLVDNGDNSIVDWLLLELRDANDPAQIIETQSVLLQKDGTVVNTMGETNITFNINGSNYYVAIRHRNHLGIMTQNPISFQQNVFIDFTDINTPTWGNHACVDMGNDKQALWAGNSQTDDKIIFQGTDNETTIMFFSVLQDTNNNNLNLNYITSGYYEGDIDMNGQCIFSGINNDPNIVFFNVLSFPDNQGLPNFIIQEQLP